MFTGIVEELGTVREVSPIGEVADAAVNIEMDVLAKHVERLLEPRLGAA